MTSGVVTGEETAGVTGEGESRWRRSKDMSRRRHKALWVIQFGEAGAIAGEGGKRLGDPSSEREVGAWVRKATRGWFEGDAHSMGTLYHTAAATAIAAFAVNAVFARN